MPTENQRALAAEMLDFVRRIPSSANLELFKDPDFLLFFEAERMLTLRSLLLDSGFAADASFEVLDVGYLHGVVPEFLHRAFPNSRFTVIDRPDSPNFSNREYLDLIATRPYIKLLPHDLAEADRLEGKFKLIILGELIEHLDPTFAVRAINQLGHRLAPGGTLLITTPNANGLVNLYTQFRGRDAAHPVIVDGTMNWPHIHLWSPTLLETTLRHNGWQMSGLRFNNGFEAQRQAQMNRHLLGFPAQIPLRLLWHVSQIAPRFRGYFVATFKRVENAYPKD